MLIYLYGITACYESKNAKANWRVIHFSDAPKNPIDSSLQIKINDIHIELTNPIDRAAEIYAHVSDKKITLSSNVIDCLPKNPEVSRQAVINYLSGNKKTGESIWVGTYVIGPGMTIQIDNLANVKISNFKPSKNHSDPIEILISAIHQKAAERKIAVRFSGGLESTSMLAACTTVTDPKNIIALTWYSREDTSSSDVLESSRIAKILGVKHLIVPINEHKLFSNEPPWRLSAYPTPALAFTNFLKDFDELATNYFYGERPIILDGHGGDHIYWEHIDAPLLRACIRHGFFIKLNEYCELNASNYLSALKSVFLGEPQTSNRILLKKHRRNSLIKKIINSPDRLRFERIREALDEIGIPRPSSDADVFYPLLRTEMIEHSLSSEVAELFNAEESRMAFRAPAYRRFGKELFLRKGKGVVTGSFQKSLHIHRHRLTQLVIDGYCANNEIIDTDKFKEIYQKSAQGVGGIDFELMKIILIELLIKQTYSAIKEGGIA